MELDEFKAYWKNTREKEIKKQKLSDQTLNQIIMKTTEALTDIQQKNNFWYNLGKPIFSILIVVLLINLGIRYFVSNDHQFFSGSVLPVATMILFAMVSMWFYKWLQQIFNVNTGENLKESLTKILSEFKRYYIISNVAYLFLFPAYYYAFIVLFLGSLHLQNNSILLICSALTIISLTGNHWYYKVKYFKKIKMLKESLNELS